MRSPKVEAVKAAYAGYGDKFEVAVVDDIATSDLSEAFKGLCLGSLLGSPRGRVTYSDTNVFSDVKAVIHVASAMDPSEGGEVLLKVCHVITIIIQPWHRR